MPNNKVNNLIKAYNLLVGGIDDEAKLNEDRAYGGIIRAGKGLLVENLTRELIVIAWDEIGGDKNRISLIKKTYKLPIKHDYIDKLKNEDIKQYIKSNINSYFYTLKADVQCYIDNKLIIGVECKAYNEKAMFKRILVDFTLFKHKFPDLHCVLLQLESQLGGDYCKPFNKVVYGSFSSHTLLSYFDVDLNIITLLEGERNVKKPIHKKIYYKALQVDSLLKALEFFKRLLMRYK